MTFAVTHLSPAELLAWMDGELPLWKRLMISRHLRGCWECRNRAADLTDTIRFAASVVSDPAPPDRAQRAKAKWRFHENVRRHEAEAVRARPKRRLLAVLAATLAIAAVFAAPLIVERRAEKREPAPAPPTAGPRRPELPAVAVNAPLPLRSLRPEPVMPAPSPVPALGHITVDPGALDGAEVDVWSTIHRSRLCVSGEVSVRRTPGAIEISGVLPTEDRRSQLLALFAAVRRQDLLQIHLRTVSELPVPEGKPVVHAGATPSEAPVENWLRERMRVGDATTQREMFDRMNAVVSNSQSLLAEAWAARRLAERFPVGLERTLPEQDRMELRAMAEDHAMAVQAHVATIAELLRPLGVMLPAWSPAGEADVWQLAAVPLQSRAAEIAGALLSLFTAGSNPELPRATVEAQIARAAAGLSEIRELAARQRDGLNPSLGSKLKRP